MTNIKKEGPVTPTLQRQGDREHCEDSSGKRPMAANDAAVQVLPVWVLDSAHAGSLCGFHYSVSPFMGISVVPAPLSAVST